MTGKAGTVIIAEGLDISQVLMFQRMAQIQENTDQNFLVGGSVIYKIGHLYFVCQTGFVREINIVQQG
jgi:hypothetical protein